MDKRAIFFWNSILIGSFIIITFFSYKIYNLNNQKNTLWNAYLNDEIGTDEKLQKKVTDLEEIDKDRKNFVFKMKKNPVNLSNVINFKGFDNNSSSSYRGLKLLHITQKENEAPLATIKFKNAINSFFEGDTLGGGKIISVTKTEMKYMKDNEIYSFSVSPKLNEQSYTN